MNSPLPMMRSVFDTAFSTVAEEFTEPVALPVLEGSLPHDLTGILLRNGPGRSQRGGHRYGHPFDGDGFLQRFCFENGQVNYRARFVQTREFLAEEAADRILFRAFGTNRPGGLWKNLFDLRFKNAANTSIIQHGGRTLALWEGGLPHRIDPDTLATLGREDFDGALRNTYSTLDAWLNPELPFAAHPRLHAPTGDLYSFGTAYGLTNRLLLHRVDPQGRLTTRDLRLRALPFVHDMALTDRYAIFFLPAVTFSIPRTLLGLRTPVQSLTLRDAPGTALVVPLDGGDPLEIPIPPGFVFHWGAAWQSRDRITLDGVKYEGFPEFEAGADLMGPSGAPSLLGRPVRYELDLVRRTCIESQLARHAMELPQCTHQGADRVLYATAAPPERPQPFLSALARLGPEQDLRLREFFPDLPGEPLLCGDYVVVQLVAHRRNSELLVLEPEHLKTVCRLQLPATVPPPLHGTWLDA